MPIALNSRAKMPVDLASMAKQYKISHRDILSVNPKTEKSEIQTYILHLAPADISGVNVCAGAGNCKRICLHFAGNPVYMTNKQAARIRRTLAYAADPKRFALILVCAILDKLNKNDGDIAVRLNGTSDIAWENVDFYVTAEFSIFCRRKFGYDLPIGQRNIFELFNIVSRDNGRCVIFYDYTKIRRNWAECKRLGYHLTFSFDGWGNSANIAIARDAHRNGVKIAAAFNIKRNQSLPACISPSTLSDMGLPLIVCDGDLSDFRPSDSPEASIIGLRFKLPHGINYSDADKKAFCIQ
jgi:hypothetical protein